MPVRTWPFPTETAVPASVEHAGQSTPEYSCVMYDCEAEVLR